MPQCKGKLHLSAGLLRVPTPSTVPKSGIWNFVGRLSTCKCWGLIERSF